jgi:hypothetical protein
MISLKTCKLSKYFNPISNFIYAFFFGKIAFVPGIYNISRELNISLYLTVSVK